MTFYFNIETGYCYNTQGSFFAANGDELRFVIAEGSAVPNNQYNSDYLQSKFNDRMEFDGGTGCFKGASGEAFTNAYVHDAVPNDEADIWHTEFFSEGNLVLKKGKRK